MRAGTLCLALFAVLAAATGTAAATENTPPLPAAGVDQTVTPGTTVYLDANGSVDPDGEITTVEWTIEPPSSGTQSPGCSSCVQTHFDATTTGEYAVTVSVTDDDGATRSDTLYITVESVATPTVSLSGSDAVTRGNETTLTASASSADAPLSSLSWVVDGDVVSQQSVSGSSATDSLTRSFDTTNNVSVRAVVYDTLGYRGSDNHTVTVEANDDSNANSRGGSSGGDSGCDSSYQFCSDADGTVQGPGGETYLVNSNGEAGIQTYIDGELTNIEDPTTSQQISTNEDGNYILEDGSTTDALARTDSGQDAQKKISSTLELGDGGDNDGTGNPSLGGGNDNSGSSDPFPNSGGGGGGGNDGGGGGSDKGGGGGGGGKGGGKRR